MAYNVKTANIYDNLPDEDAENVQSVEVPAKQAAAKAKEADKIMPSVAAGVEARMKGNANGPQPGGGRSRQEGRGRGGGRGIRQGTDQPTRAETGEVDVGGAGERNSRARIPRGKDLGKRHEHDRFDGTGRGHETEKREGGGKGNWGNIDEEIQAQEAAVTEVKGAAADPAGDEPAEVPVSAEAAEPPKEEKEMTLEEYEKLREEKRAGLNKKASSDVKADPKAFEGMKAYTRSTGEEEKNGLELSNKKQIGQRKSGLVEKTRKEKELLETGFRVGQQETGRGGRGRGFDRGGRRDDRPGRGDRGGDRGERGERVDRGDREDRPPRRSESGGQNGSREGGRGGRGEGGRGGRGEGGRGGRGEGSRGGRGEGGRGRGGYGRGDRPFGGRGRGRDGSAPAIDDASAFPTLGGNGA